MPLILQASANCLVSKKTILDFSSFLDSEFKYSSTKSDNDKLSSLSSEFINTDLMYNGLGFKSSIFSLSFGYNIPMSKLPSFGVNNWGLCIPPIPFASSGTCSLA